MSTAKRESGERGATIVLVAVALTALMSVVALAVDVGMLLNAKSEAQRAADAGAMAGAGMLLSMWADPDAGTAAAAEAINFGEMNNVFDQMAVIQPGDVDVDLVNSTVTVRVRREASRGNPVLTWFANVFGVSEVDISADATAAVGLASNATCVKPWTIPDAWDDADGDETYDEGEYYAAEETGWGTDFRDFGHDGYGQMGDDLGEDYLGDRGRQVMVKAGNTGNPGGATGPGWYYPWDIEQDGPDAGGDRYRTNIWSCNSGQVSLGEEYMVENGKMVGPTKQGVDSLISLDPEAHWDSDCDCVAGVAATYGAWTASPRIVVVPFFDPTRPFDPGKKPIVFNNFGLMFLEEMQGNTVVARFLGYSPGSGGGQNNPGVNLLRVTLVE